MTLYLSGGGAVGAWQAGVLYCKIVEERKRYTHVVGQSVGALNACLLAGNIARFANEDERLSTDEIWEKAAEQMRIFWTERIHVLGFPKQSSLILGVLCCLSRGHAIEKSSARQMMRAAIGEIGGMHYMDYFGKTVNDTYVPKVSIYTYLVQASPIIDRHLKMRTPQTILFRFDRNETSAYELRDSASHPYLVWEKTTIDFEELYGKMASPLLMRFWGQHDAVNANHLRAQIVRGSISIPMVFPPVVLGNSDMVFIDGAVQHALPVVFQEDLKDSIEIIACMHLTDDIHPSHLRLDTIIPKHKQLISVSREDTDARQPKISALDLIRLMRLGTINKCILDLYRRYEAVTTKVGDYKGFVDRVLTQCVFLPHFVNEKYIHQNTWNELDFRQTRVRELFNLGRDTP